MVNISRAATIAAGLLGSSIASAGAISVGTTGSVVGADGVGVRPGLSVGYLPTPSTALELHGDSSFDGAWDVGLMLAGRWYPSPALEPGRGIFLLGRLGAGVSGVEADVGPWTTLAGGFGARPNDWLSVEAFAGPEWSMSAGGGWRTGLSVSFLFDPSARKDTQRHRVVREPG